jgi:hypothetical protein
MTSACRPKNVAQITDAPIAGIFRGTEGSKPISSSEEAGANHFRGRVPSMIVGIWR